LSGGRPVTRAYATKDQRFPQQLERGSIVASVKGSKQEQMIVVPLRFWHRWAGKLLLVALAVGLPMLTLQWGIVVGRDQVLAEDGGFSASAEGGLGEQISRMVDGEDSEVQRLNEELLRLDQASQVDKLTMQNLRVSVQRLRQQISLLEEDVLFYKNIAGTGVEETGLAVSKLDLLASETTNHFRYTLRFEQAGRTGRTLEGFANLAIVGVKDDMEQTLPLAAITSSTQGENIKLRFRSFQDVEGEFTLPVGFEPLRVEILAITEAPDSKTLQKNFSWLVESDQPSTDTQR
jgi:hypothetical protein